MIITATKPTTMLEWALRYLDYGWALLAGYGIDETGACRCYKARACPHPGKHPVFGPDGKVPPPTKDPADIKRLFGNGRNNIIVIPGEISNTVFLDLDKHGKDGVKNFFMIIEKYGRELPPVPQELTGGGGIHIPFKYDPRIAKSINVGNGIELKSNRSFITVAPSLHASGKRYEWTKSPEELPIIEMPEWLIEAFEVKPQERTHIPEEDEAIDEGSRNETLFKIGCKLRAANFSQKQIIDALLIKNRDCVPPLPEREVIDIGKSVGTRYAPGISSEFAAQASGPRVEANGVCYIDDDEEDGTSQTQQEEPQKDISIEHLIPETGFFRDFVEYHAKITDCPRRFLFASALMSVVALCRNKFRVKFKAFTLKPNLYYLLLAGSTEFRKTTALNLTKKLVRRFEVDERGNVTPESKIVYPKEWSKEGLYEVMKTQSAGTHFCAEFGAFMAMLNKQYNEGTKADLTDLYDSPDCFEKVLKKDRLRINDPCVSIFAASTVQWFNDTISMGDLEGGFLYRFLIMPARTQEKFVALPPEDDDEDGTGLIYDDEYRNIVDFAACIVRLPAGRMKISPEARELYEAWAEELKTRKFEARHEPFKERYGMAAIKMAQIYQASFVAAGECSVTEVDDVYTYNISKRAMEYGIANIEFNFKEIFALYNEDISFSETEKNRQIVAKIIKKAGRKGIFTKNLVKGLKGMATKDRNDSIQYLVDSDEIRVEQIFSKSGQRKPSHKYIWNKA